MIKALTVSQPYASLIASGDKWIENRIWATSYRGELAIHAGLGKQYLTKRELDNYPTGCVLCITNLVACVDYWVAETMAEIRPDERVPGTMRTWKEVWEHKHAEGPFLWILENTQNLLIPIPATGKQRLWNFSL